MKQLVAGSSRLGIGQLARGTLLSGKGLSTATAAVVIAAQVIAMHDRPANPVPSPSIIGMYSGTESPVDKSEDDPQAVELGIRFTVSQPGDVVGARYYKSPQNMGVHTATLWKSNGAKLATAYFTNESNQGWQSTQFSTPVALTPGASYVISYHTSYGHYAQLEREFSHGKTVGGSIIRGTAGVYSYGGSAFPTSSWNAAGYYVDALFRPVTGVPPTAPPSSTPPSNTPPTKNPPPSTAPPTKTPPPTTAPPTTTPPSSAPPVISPPSSTFPNASNTGVPAGTKLTPSQGFRTTRDGQIIDGLDVTGTIYVDNMNVIIRNSRIKADQGGWAVDIGRNGPASLVILDSELDGNQSDQGGIRNQSNGSSWVGQRLNIHNGENGARLGGNAVLTDSWLHDFVSDSDAPHYDGVEIYEGSNNVVRHNTINLDQDETSCVNVQGDFGKVTNVVIDHNLLNGGGWILNIRKIGANPVTGTVVTGNDFGSQYGFGYGAIDAPSTTIQGNVLQSTGKNIDSQI